MDTQTIEVPTNLDHLVLTAPSLEQGMDYVESKLGIRPVPGGRHPGYGTHNALLSLGKNRYLEVIAPDPTLSTTTGKLLFNDYFKNPPKLSRWVIRSEAIDSLVSTARNQGLDLGAVSEGSRETPDGTTISWKLTDPSVIPLYGAIPFIIDWGNTPHPSGSVPFAGELIGFSLEHPSPGEVRKKLKLMGIIINIKEAEAVRLIARIKTKNGTVELY